MLPPQKTITLSAFHGTTQENAESIISSNFIIHFHPENWLGHGVYFFTNGISCPKKNAQEWAKNCHGETPTTIVRSEISVPEKHFLDLTSVTQLKIYNEARDWIVTTHAEELENRRDLAIKKRRDIRLDDQIITNLVLEKLDIQVLIHNTYIKNEMQRKLVLESSYPNATVCCVTNIDFIHSSAIHIDQSKIHTSPRKNHHQGILCI
jgi:hypothetical protein